MKFFLWVIACFILLVLTYFLWASSGKNYDAFKSPVALTGEISSEGADIGKGNFVAIQPYLVPADYCSSEHFKKALLPYFQKAMTGGYLGPNSIVILPEHSGTWLVTHDEKASVYEADSMSHAISLIVNSNLFKFITNITSAKVADKINQTLFLMKAQSMGKAYDAVFSSLATQFKVTIVAGSIILPDPSVDNNGRLKTRKGLLYNAAFIFGPDGKIIGQPVKKEHLRNEEKNFVSAAKDMSKALIETPAGSIYLLFSADSIHRENQTGNIIFMTLQDDHAKAAIPRVESEASVKRNENTIRNSIFVSYSGRLWEKEYEGKIITQQGDSVKVFKPENSKWRIVNLWLK